MYPSCSDRTRSWCRCKTEFPTGTFTAIPASWRARGCTASIPSGLIGEHIPCERVIGCVVYPAAELLSPGVIKHVEGNRFPVGEPNGDEQRARHARVGVLHQRRPAGAGAQRHPRRDLAEALGQPDLQSDQRPVARHAGRHLSVSAEPRRCRGDDDRGTDRRQQARHHLSRIHREAHQRRGAGGSPQDLDAAGCRGRAHARNRRAARFGGGTGPIDRHADSSYRYGVCADDFGEDSWTRTGLDRTRLQT